MKNVNLIPAPRRDAKRRRKQRTTCALVCGAYAVVLLLGVGVAQLAFRGSGAVLGERINAAANDIRRLEKQTDEARIELASARATIEANRTVAEQPDWSVILALLAKTTGNDVVLKTVTIALPISTTNTIPSQGTTAPPPEYVLDVAGVGRSQLAVSQHVLRLEETGLFSRVSLVDTAKEAFLGDNATAFRIQCTFGDGPLGRTPTAAAETGGVIR
jgi:hypothetical protein